MATQLGFVPNKGQVILSTGADLIFNLESDGEAWPSGTTCQLKFPSQGLTFDATISGVVISFKVESASVDPIPNGAIFRIYLTRPTSPTSEYLWWTGTVARKDK